MHRHLISLAALLACAGPAAAQTAPAASPAFSVIVDLTPRAAARLARDHETIIVDAFYFGTATRAGRSKADESGELGWNPEERRELTGAGTASFPSHRFKPGMLKLIERPDVLINVFSGRRANENNILDCGIFQDSVFLAAKEPIKIHCDLI